MAPDLDVRASALSRRSRLVLRSGAVLSLLLLTACPKAPTPAEQELDRTIALERAAALFAEERLGAAREALSPLLERRAVNPEDLLAMGIVEYALSSYDTARPLLEQALAALPNSASANFAMGSLVFDEAGFERGEQLIQRAHELLPDDYPTQLRLANIKREIAIDLEDVGFDAEASDDAEGAQTAFALADAKLAEAEGLYQDLIGRGVAFGGSWHIPALRNYATLLNQAERFDEAKVLNVEATGLEQRDIPKPTNTEMSRGNLAKLSAPAPRGSVVTPRPPTELPRIAQIDVGERSVLALQPLDVLESWHTVVVADLENPTPGQEGDDDPGRAVADGTLDAGDLLARTDTGAVLITGAGGNALTDLDAADAELRDLVGLELGEDQSLRDFVEGEGYTRSNVITSDIDWIEVLEVNGRSVVRSRDLNEAGEPRSSIELPGLLSQLVPTDIDHDGDLDLIAVGDFGARWLRHNGAEANGSYVLAGAPAETGEGDSPDGEQAEGATEAPPTDLPIEGWPMDGSYTWVVPEDFDTDQDTDLLFGGPNGLLLLDSLRNDRFLDVSERLSSDISLTVEPLVADWNADGFPDLLDASSGVLVVNRFGDLLEPGGVALPKTLPENAPEGLRALAADFDLDGSQDLLWVDAEGRLTGVLAPGLTAMTPLAEIELGARPFSPLAVSDWDRDGIQELFVLDPAGQVAVHDGQLADGVQLALKGIKDNSRGVGAVVEIRSGPIYRRIYWRGGPQVIGLGGRDKADVIRVTWPNGVVQSLLDTPAGSRRVLEQIEGLVGSCPFLYTWDGERYVFISDVIGITPLGLPMAPGMLVSPDHDEYVLVLGEQLAPKDGELILQLTEELREVSYFDAVELIAVDHPEGTEVYPNERFSFPPFPETHLFSVESSVAPVRALGSDGTDWAPELAEVDGEVSAPFTAKRGQFQGLTDPHTLELEFEPGSLAAAAAPRLLMTGWLFWTNASINLASARHPDYAFVPPILQVPDGDGGWRDIGPPVGFPAGKTKTMVIDLAPYIASGAIDPSVDRIRIFSTLRLYWDEIRLATCADDGLRRETRLAASSAELWERGFSRPERLEPHGLEWFDWSDLEQEPRWNQHPGFYTRFGDVRPLLGAIDDQFVIMGAGDCLTVKFNADDLPPVPQGWRRDYLVFLDGWAKDRDPNTVDALFVEPLPFHSMSAYPPPPGETYPDTPETRAYRAEWNTRLGRRLILSLLPLQAAR